MTSRSLVAIALITCASVAAAPVPSLPAAKAQHARLLDVAAAGDRVVAVGEEGVILVSSDGKSWEQKIAPVDTMLTRLRFVDAKHGWALGWDAIILETRDAGETWTLRHDDEKAGALYDALFLDDQHGFAAGAYGAFLETTDGGATWSTRAGFFDDIGMHVNALLRLPSGAIVAAGERGLVAFSTDAGANWQLLDTPYGGSWFGALPHGDNGVVVFGMRGNVMVADDVARCAKMDATKWDPYSRENVEDASLIAARGWKRIANDQHASFFGGLTTNPQSALLVGFNGAVDQLDLVAGTLRPVKVPSSETLVKLAALKGELIAVGRRGATDLGPAQ